MIARMKGRRDLKGLRRGFSVGVAKPLEVGEGSPLARVRIWSRSIIRGAGELVPEEEEESLLITLASVADEEEGRGAGVSGSISRSWRGSEG